MPPVDPHVDPVLFAPACDVIVTTVLALGAAALSTSVDGLIVHPGSSTAVPAADTEQLSDTIPVNPFAAVANTITVLPVVAPAVTLNDPGVVPIVKLPAPPEEPDPDPDPPTVIAAAISFAPSTDPQPVDRSNPAATSYPASPPVSPADDGVLLLHIEGTLTEQPTTPAVASVTS